MVCIRKGLTPAIWLIVAIVVALSVALILIVVVGKMGLETEKEGTGIISDAGSGVSLNIKLANCKARCTNCCVTGGDCGSITCEYEDENGVTVPVPGWSGCSCGE